MDAGAVDVGDLALDPPDLELPGFAGIGSISRLIAERDWGSTPLGDPACWPEALRTSLGIMLASRQTFVMWWGPDLAFMYNDAFIPHAANKHPWGFGRPGREVWAEIWDIIGPMLQGVLATGQPTWRDDQLLEMDRKGFMEETYWTYSYSAIRHADGEVLGVFTATTETTARVLGARRLRTLHDLAERTGDARSVEAVCTEAVTAMAANGADLPFSALYLMGQDDQPMRTASVGLPEGADAWAFSALTESTGATVVDVPARFGPLGPWAGTQPVTHALVVPIDNAVSRRRAGFLVVGASPRLDLDSEYRGFVELCARQISTAVGGASSLQAERQRAEALATLDRAKTAFFSNVSHEFRTPLSLILGPVEDALAEPQARPIDQERLELVQRNVVRLGKLVNNMLDFSRIEGGGAQPEVQSTDLAQFTADLASQFRAVTDRAGLDLDVSCPPLPILVDVDRDMWEKIVLNLVSNAFKFTLEGRIGVSVAAQDGYAVLRVSDTGGGIPAEELPRLFERFHRVQASRARTQEGTGIGLALVSELARLHGGDVAAASEVGAGSTFTVRVPLTGDAGAKEADASSASARVRGAVAYVEEALRWLPDAPGLLDSGSPEPSAGPCQGGGARIVVADDNADLRQYLARVLRPYWDVEIHADGLSALAAIRADVPDLVITDVMMPRLDGFGLLHALRSEPATRMLPVIMLSARAGEEAAVEGLSQGADDYLQKPFASRELVARVRANLDLASLRQEAARAAALEAERLARLAAAAIKMSRCRSIDDCLKQATEAARHIVGAHQGVASLTDGGPSGQAIQSVSLSERYDRWRDYDEEPVGEGIWPLPLVERRPYRLTQAELEAHPEWRGFGRAAEGHPPMRGWLAVPMLCSDDQPVGLIQLSDKHEGDFSAQDESLLVQLAQLAAARVEALRAFEREHRVAITLQQSLLPADLPPVPGFHLAGRYVAGSTEAAVGGDWYDAIALSDSSVALVVGDVVGRGVQAAATMGQLRNALRAFLLQGHPPGTALGLLNQLVVSLGDTHFSTVIAAVLDTPTRTLRLASAGHPPPLVVAAEGCTAWVEGGRSVPLGALKEAHYEETTIEIPPGASVLLYTDGLIERRRASLADGMDRLAETARDFPGDPCALVDSVLEAMSTGTWNDDVVVFGLTRQPTAPEPLVVGLPSTPSSVARMRTFLGSWLRQLGLSDDDTYDLVLAVSELTANAVEHPREPSRPSVLVAASVDDEDVVVAVSDRGRWKDARPGDDRGRGLGIVDAFVDCRSVERSPEGTTVAVRKRWRSGDG